MSEQWDPERPQQEAAMKATKWIYELPQPIAIRIRVTPEDGTSGVDVTEVLLLDGLRWSFDQLLVPGPDDVQ
jgi:hypothetical protein